MNEVVRVSRFSIERSYHSSKVKLKEVLTCLEAMNFAYHKELGMESENEILVYVQPNHYQEHARTLYKEFDAAQGLFWFTKSDVVWYLGEVCEDSKEA